jgi:hypothetical protein
MRAEPVALQVHVSIMGPLLWVLAWFVVVHMCEYGEDIQHAEWLGSKAATGYCNCMRIGKSGNFGVACHD